MKVGFVFPPFGITVPPASPPASPPCAIWQNRRCQRDRFHTLEAIPEPSGDLGSDDANTKGTASSRYSFLQRSVTSAILASAGLGGMICLPAVALDPQKNARTAQPPPQALLLPVQQIRAAVRKVNDLLDDPSGWEEARTLLHKSPLSKDDFTTILDRYSDSNWERHILGDLYRNQGLENMKALDEVIAYVLQQEAEGEGISQEDIDDVQGAGQALATCMDDFFGLAPSEDRKLLEKLVEDGAPSR